MGIFSDCACGCGGKKQEEKLFISFQAALLFFIRANPLMFRLMRNLLSDGIASSSGCATVLGVAIHAVVFMFITWGMMNLKKYN